MLMMLTSLAEIPAKLKPLSLSSLRSIGLSVNESKTKLLLSAAKDTSIGVSVEIDGYNFEVVKDFVYLGSSITSVWKSDVGLLLLIDITLD